MMHNTNDCMHMITALPEFSCISNNNNNNVAFDNIQQLLLFLMQMKANHQKIQDDDVHYINCTREEITTLCTSTEWPQGFYITGLAKTANDRTATYVDNHNRAVIDEEDEVFSTTAPTEADWINNIIIDDELKQVITMFLTQ